MKYIDAEKLKSLLRKKYNTYKIGQHSPFRNGKVETLRETIELIDSLQQDETQVDKMLCSQVWWEEQGWIMIPPDATVEGIDSLLMQVRKKLQQEQPELDLEKELDRYLRGEFQQTAGGNFNNYIQVARHFYALGVLKASWYA